MTRAQRLALATMLSVIAPAFTIAAPAVLGATSARADEAPIAVGTELLATSDVTLHTAEIAKGSRVSVTKVMRTGDLETGDVGALNVALADGHVVKVTMAQVHTFFRVVSE